jgi:hypothetical protein
MSVAVSFGQQEPKHVGSGHVGPSAKPLALHPGSPVGAVGKRADADVA